jgi:hypothetical protein
MSLLSVDELLQKLDLDDRRLEMPQSVTVPHYPDATIPAMIHRNSDGNVSIGRKIGHDKWEPLGNVPVRHLTGLWRDEVFQEAADQQAYFSLNTFCDSDRCKPAKNQLDMLAPPLRKISALRHLTCCWVDMDGYKHGLDKHDLYASVMRRAERGEIPVPSIFTLSRGVWAIWILKDRLDPEQPIRTDRKGVVYDWHQRIQRELHKQLADVGSDRGSQDGARMTRIPGTINASNGQRVGYMVPLGPDQKPFHYTLDDLDYFLRPPEKTKRLVYRQGNGGKSPAKQRGFRSRFEWLVKRLQWLRMARRGWSVGYRDQAMLLLAIALKGTGWDIDRVEETFREHLEDMAQPVNDRMTMRNCFKKYEKADFREGGPTNQYVADVLCVTVAEAAELSRKEHPFPAASQFPRVAKKTRTEREQERHEFIQRTWDLAKQHGQTLSGSSMAERLAGHGLDGCRATVLNDMRKLGLIAPKKPAPDRQMTMDLE